LAERIALMLADHMSVEEVCQELCSDGADRPDLLGVVREYDSHPLMRLSQHLALELKKRNHLLSVYRDINSASQFSGTVERVGGLGREEFRERYYSTNRPVIFQGLMAGKEPFCLLTPEFLRSRFGEAMIEIQDRRTSIQRYEEAPRQLATTVRFVDFVNRLLETPFSNDFYMTSNNGFANERHFYPLWREYEILPEYLDPAKLEVAVPSLWFGPGG